MINLPALDDPEYASTREKIRQVYGSWLTPDIDPLEFWVAVSHWPASLPSARWACPNISVPAMMAAVKYVQFTNDLEDLGIEI
jgi:hypothetical protein